MLTGSHTPGKVPELDLKPGTELRRPCSEVLCMLHLSSYIPPPEKELKRGFRVLGGSS